VCQTYANRKTIADAMRDAHDRKTLIKFPPPADTAPGLTLKVQLKAAIISFFVECSKLEMPVLGVALRSLSKDAEFVERAEKLLDVEARYTLLTRLGAARDIPSGTMQRLAATVSRARKLRERRDQIARNLMVAEHEPGTPSPALGQRRIAGDHTSEYAHLSDSHAAWLPEVAQIDAYTAEAVELQQALSSITENMNQHLTAINA
jgi:hypothetical protein